MKRYGPNQPTLAEAKTFAKSLGYSLNKTGYGNEVRLKVIGDLGHDGIFCDSSFALWESLVDAMFCARDYPFGFRKTEN